MSKKILKIMWKGGNSPANVPVKRNLSEIYFTYCYLNKQN